MRAATLHQLKQNLWKYAPPLFYCARAVRRAMHQSREARIAMALGPARTAFAARYGYVVQDGPFRGMKYVGHAFGSPFLPKLVGSYEAEIRNALEKALCRTYPRIVDIGCDEGYYAVGMLLRSPKSLMYAFEIDPTARTACQQMADLNAVSERLVLNGECTVPTLKSVLVPETLIICDCEGAEFELLDPVWIPELLHADIIVELHDHERLDVAITPTLLDRFRDSHEITLLDRMPRVTSDYPCLRFLPPDQRIVAIHEDRMPKQQWAVMIARSRPT